MRREIAGEEINGKLLYLIATSRLFDHTMHAAIKGTSAGGKSEIRKQVLQFFPPESIVALTSISEKALVYYDGDFAHKIFSMAEAVATEEQSFQDYLLRELMSEGRINHATVQKIGDQIVSVPEDEQHESTDDFPGLVRAADLIGQLADINYLRKQAALFNEFRETGMSNKLQYNGVADLRANYPDFFWKTVRPYIGDASRYLRVTQEGQQWIANLYANVFSMEHRGQLS